MISNNPSQCIGRSKTRLVIVLQKDNIRVSYAIKEDTAGSKPF
jgi:hypothetical protein